MAFLLAAPLLEAAAGGAAVEGAGAAAAGGAAAAEGGAAAAGGTAAAEGAASGAGQAAGSSLASHFTGGHSESRGDNAPAPAGPGVAHQTNPVFNY
jgi:streptogrisin D